MRKWGGQISSFVFLLIQIQFQFMCVIFQVCLDLMNENYLTDWIYQLLVEWKLDDFQLIELIETGQAKELSVQKNNKNKNVQCALAYDIMEPQVSALELNATV